MEFKDFGFKKFINDALNDLNFVTPTNIQKEVIPLIKKHHPVIGLANTGTGKSHSFILPIINNLEFDLKDKIQFIIMSPTRELAQQLYGNIMQIKKFNAALTCSLIISGSMDDNKIKALEKNQSQIIIGTPKSLKEMYDQKILKLTTAKYIVIDECDMIFNLDFIDDVDYLLSKMNLNNLEISMFSATISNKIKSFINKYIKNALLIDLVKNEKINQKISHNLIWTKNKSNLETLDKLLVNLNPYIAMIFVNKKEEIAQVLELLHKNGINQVGELHGNLSNRQRDMMIKRIKNNDFKYIVVSDLAARGIDIKGVSHVISLDLPKNLEFYIHRSGRTGREGSNEGYSYIFSNYKNEHLIKKIKDFGIKFNEFDLNNNKIIKKNLTKNNKNINSKTSVQEQKIIGKFKGKKIKPGYKKKRKSEIDELHRKVRRDHIKESIKKIKEEKYKERRKKIFLE
ncbi:DEAD/DEAH box helicase [Spiroplasma endosymbiont of Labia minor]|uniref:DEAD/DEAH box helicase n=1 Tax=Spiroplasma endosymbiont of Labia minor TaxID=3066305 RepID=UPI0030D4C579